MTDFPASHRDLLDAKSFGVFSTYAPSGHPQSTAVAFFHDDEDGEVKLSLNTSRKKVRNLRNNPACNLFLLDLANPMRYLEIRANAELADDEGKAFAAKAGRKYDSDFTQYDQPGEGRVIVTLRPVAVSAVDMLAPPPE
jgi:PPOX class probable F420-dependent enzyme